MIVSITNDDQTTAFDITAIADEQVKQEATVIVQKVGNLQVIIEALDFASRAHRSGLEELLKECDEAIVEAEEVETEEESSEETSD